MSGLYPGMLTIRSTMILAAMFAAACTTEYQEPDESFATDEAELANYANSIQNQGTLTCLSSGSASGSAVTLAACNGASAQQFEVIAGGYGASRIRKVGTSLCVTPAGTGYQQATISLVLAACGAASNSQADWDKASPVSITNGERTGFRWRYDSAFCLESASGALRARNGACSPLGNAQKFDVRLVAPPPPPPPPPTTCSSGYHCCEWDADGCSFCLPNSRLCP